MTFILKRFGTNLYETLLKINRLVKECKHCQRLVEIQHEEWEKRVYIENQCPRGLISEKEIIAFCQLQITELEKEITININKKLRVCNDHCRIIYDRNKIDTLN